MIAYFGCDERGYFIDDTQGVRQYVSQSVWNKFIDAAHTPPPDAGNTLKLIITEKITVEKFNCESDRINDSVPVEVITL